MRHGIKMRTPNAIIAYANHATIAPGKSAGEFHVMSRMLLWCRAGEGNITVNCESRSLRPGDMMFMPWGHRIRYFNSSKEPWRISGIHIIPDLPPGSPFEYKVKHGEGQKIIGDKFRRDANLGKVLKGVLTGRLVYPSPLSHLAEYTVELFIRGNQTEGQSRMIACLLLPEIEYSVLNPLLHASSLPIPLVKMCDFAEARLARKIFLHDLVKAGGVSPATVCRLFSRHLGVRPFEWINRKRMEKASELLLSTDLRIGEIADKVGIGDHYYFSKLFTKMKDIPPGKFRRNNASVI
jgi:AraC-like DNA-binding protein